MKKTHTHTNTTPGFGKLVAGPRSQVYRHWVRIGDYSVTVIPKVGNTSLRSLGVLENYPTGQQVGVMRHPLIRLVSAWKHRGQAFYGHMPRWETFFEDVLAVGDPFTLDRHLRPQIWYFDPFPEVIVPLELLGKLLHIDVPVLNTTIHPGMRSYSHEQAERARAYYAADMDLWESIE